MVAGQVDQAMNLTMDIQEEATIIPEMMVIPVVAGDQDVAGAGHLPERTIC